MAGTILIGGFEKRQLVESCHPKKKGDFRLLAEALWRVPHVCGGTDGKASIERFASLLMSKNLLTQR